MQFSFLLDRLLLVTIAARVQVGGFSIGEKKPAVQAGSFQFLNTSEGKNIMTNQDEKINQAKGRMHHTLNTLAARVEKIRKEKVKKPRTLTGHAEASRAAGVEYIRALMPTYDDQTRARAERTLSNMEGV